MRRGAVAALTISLIIVAAAAVLVMPGCSKDYSGVFVADLPLSEQVKVARCVRLSSVVNWGEGGSIYCRQVVEAFLLDYPFPDFLDEKYGSFDPVSPRDRERGAIAFLIHTSFSGSGPYGVPRMENVAYGRRAHIYTGTGIYQIELLLDRHGNILRSASTFAPYRYSGVPIADLPQGQPDLIYDEQRQIFMLDYDAIDKLPKALHPAYNRTIQLPGFVYDEENARFVHRKSGLWYVIKNGRRVFPAELYIEPGKYEIAYVEVENRPDDVWVHASTTEIIVQPGNSLAWIGNALPQQYRMSIRFGLAERERFFERNGIKDPDRIFPGQVLVYHNYVDREAPVAISEYVRSFSGRFYVGRDRFGYAQLVRIEQR
jgi:hypothetical protein